MSRRLRVAICAAGRGGIRSEFLGKEWERWGVNATWNLWGDVEKKFSRWFELHRRSYVKWEQGGEPNAHLIWLKNLRTLPVYVQEPGDWPELLTARPFPFKRVQRLAPDFANYHACSIDWMIALAIAEGAKEIALYGVEQDHSAEPLGSRACVEFWSGFAVARGIKVTSIDGSTFRLAQLTFTDTPYALDPKWLTRGDNGNGHSTIKTLTSDLAATVDGK